MEIRASYPARGMGIEIRQAQLETARAFVIPREGYGD